MNTILNVVLFAPLGFFLPLLYKKYSHISTVALTGFLFSLSIEIVQMFGRGATDINDLITNTVGACLGFFIYQLLNKLIPKEICGKFQAYKINDRIEVLFLIIFKGIIEALNANGIKDIEEANAICEAAGLDPYKTCEETQPICFENAKWAYVVGCAIAIKKGCKNAADAAEAIGIGFRHSVFRVR